MSPEQEISNRLRAMPLVGMALMASGPVYAVILFTMGMSRPAGAVGPLVLPLSVLALVITGASFIVPPLLVRQPPAPPSPTPLDALYVAISRYFTQVLVAMAMGEAVILLGFVLGFVQRQPELILPFLLVGEVVMFLNFPRRSRLERPLSGEALALLQRLAG